MKTPKKKARITRKGAKKQEFLAVDATFEQIIKITVAGNPKPKKKAS